MDTREKMKNKEIQDRIRVLIEEKYGRKGGISKFAEVADLQQSSVSRSLADGNKVGKTLIRKVVDIFGVNVEWIETGVGLKYEKGDFQPKEYKIPPLVKKKLPLISITTLGLYRDMSYSMQIHDEDVIDYYYIPEFEQLGCAFLIANNGYRMRPTYESGDKLACKPVLDNQFFEPGQVYAINTTMGIIISRIFEDADGRPEYVSIVFDDKEAYPSYSIRRSEIKCLYMVLGCIKIT